MLHPEQVRERLREAGQCYQNDDTDAAVSVLIGLFYDILPELVGAAQNSRDVYGNADAARRYGDVAPATQPHRPESQPCKYCAGPTRVEAFGEVFAQRACDACQKAWEIETELLVR